MKLWQNMFWYLPSRHPPSLLYLHRGSSLFRPPRKILDAIMAHFSLHSSHYSRFKIKYSPTIVHGYITLTLLSTYLEGSCHFIVFYSSSKIIYENKVVSSTFINPNFFFWPCFLLHIWFTLISVHLSFWQLWHCCWWSSGKRNCWINMQYFYVCWYKHGEES